MEQVGPFTFVVSEAKEFESPSARPVGMSGLNISAAVAAAEERPDAKAPSEEEAVVRKATQPVTVLFDLPDGSQIEGDFQMGQTVEVLKSFVAEEADMPMAGQSLFLEDGTGPLMDPMSIMDYRQIDPREEVYIRVDGRMESGGAKK